MDFPVRYLYSNRRKINQQASCVVCHSFNLPNCIQTIWNNQLFHTTKTQPANEIWKLLSRALIWLVEKENKKWYFVVPYFSCKSFGGLLNLNLRNAQWYGYENPYSVIKTKQGKRIYPVLPESRTWFRFLVRDWDHYEIFRKFANYRQGVLS